MGRSGAEGATRAALRAGTSPHPRARPAAPEKQPAPRAARQRGGRGSGEEARGVRKEQQENVQRKERYQRGGRGGRSKGTGPREGGGGRPGSTT